MERQGRPRSWTNRLVRLVRAALTHQVGRSFEREALPWARAVWPDLVLEKGLGAIDSSGIDASVGIDRSPISVVVQFKGLEVADDELGTAQIAACAHTIDRFRKSEYRTAQYILVHNRSGKNREFSSGLVALVQKLKAGGHAVEAEVWDLKLFIDHAMTSLLHRFVKFAAIPSRRRQISRLIPFDEPVKDVPFLLGTLQAETTSLRIPSEPATARVGDPLEVMCGPSAHRITVVLGEFGFGKSTLLERLATSLSGPVVLAHGALLDPDPSNAKEFLAGCLRPEVDSFLDQEIPEGDRDVLRRVFPVVVDQALKHEGHFDAVIVDALDESEALERPGGGHQLFNSLRDVRAKVVLGMRTEFWRRKEPTFAQAFGHMPTKKPPRVIKISRVELAEWDKSQILEFARRFRHASAAETAARVDLFIQLVEEGGYESLFGDIPRRPLFLNFVLDSVAASGLPTHSLRRAELLLNWARQKVARDYEAPAIAGGAGRPPLAHLRGGLEETVKLSMLLMRKTSRCMSYAEGGQIIQQAHCLLDEVRRSDPELEELGSDVGVLLNSLLQEARDNPIRGLYVRFAHRIFQDFFLAWELVVDGSAFGSAQPSQDVSEWCIALRELADIP